MRGLKVIVSNIVIRFLINLLVHVQEPNIKGIFIRISSKGSSSIIISLGTFFYELMISGFLISSSSFITKLVKDSSNSLLVTQISENAGHEIPFIGDTGVTYTCMVS